MRSVVRIKAQIKKAEINLKYKKIRTETDFINKLPITVESLLLFFLLKENILNHEIEQRKEGGEQSLAAQEDMQ